MTMKAMMKRHVNRFIICIPALRDAVTNRPTTFQGICKAEVYKRADGGLAEGC